MYHVRQWQVYERASVCDTREVIHTSWGIGGKDGCMPEKIMGQRTLGKQEHDGPRRSIRKGAGAQRPTLTCLERASSGHVNAMVTI